MDKPTRARDTGRWPGACVIIFFVLWSLWLSFQYLAFGARSYVPIHDNADSQIASNLALPRLSERGQLGLWDNLPVCGVDRFSAGFTTESYSLLFLALPGWLAAGFLVWLQRFLAGYFTFRLLRESLDADALPSLYGGMTYSLFCQTTINAQWMGFKFYDGLGLPALPFILWALGRAAATTGLRPCLVAAGLGILLAVTSVHAFGIFALPLVLFWLLFVTRDSIRRSLILSASFAAGWLLSESWVLWASLLNTPLSHRAHWAPNSPLSLMGESKVLWAGHLIHDNAVPGALALIGVIISRLRHRPILACLGASALILAFVIVYPLLRARLGSHLGFIASFQIDRFYLLVPFLAAVSGAMGLSVVMQRCLSKDALHSRGCRRPFSAYREWLGWLAAVALIGLVVRVSATVNDRVANARIRESNYAALYGNPDLVNLSARMRHLPPFRVATVATVDMWGEVRHPDYVWAYGLESADGYIPLYPRRYQEFWELVIAPLTSVDRSTYLYFHDWGSRVHLFPPAGAVGSRKPLDFAACYNLDLLSLANVRYLISPEPLDDPRLVLLPSHAIMKSGDISVYVYENRQALPRFFVVGEVRVFESEAAELQALRQASRQDLGAVAFVTRSEVMQMPLGQLGKKAGMAAVSGFSSDLIRLSAVAKSPSILVISNSYSPFWRARVDGKRSPIFPVDHAFQGVFLEGGVHEVVLEYRPPYAFWRRR